MAHTFGSPYRTKAMELIEDQTEIGRSMFSDMVSEVLAKGVQLDRPEALQREIKNTTTWKDMQADFKRKVAYKGDSYETDPIPYFGMDFPRQDLMVEAISKSMSEGFGMDGRWPSFYTKTDVLATVGGSQSVLIRTDLIPHLNVGVL